LPSNGRRFVVYFVAVAYKLMLFQCLSLETELSLSPLTILAFNKHAKYILET
jgi:hypothetical protein